MSYRKRIKTILVPLFLVVILSSVAQPVAAYGGSHQNFTYDAIDLLRSELSVNEIYTYRSSIKNGNFWADNDNENPDRKCHFHAPDSHLGLEGVWRSAAEVADEGIQKAIDHYSQGNVSGAFFWLGFALHHVQDLCTPCHTQIFTLGFTYHEDYESWIDSNYDTYSGLATTPIYTFDEDSSHHNPDTPFGWVDYAAHKSSQYVDECRNYYFGAAARVLVPFTIELSAGFILWAYHQMRPNVDVDGDGLTYSDEVQIGTFPWTADTDGDTMPDDWEVSYNLNPLSASDKYSDPDGDNLSNYREYLYGTNPKDSDTDGDTMSDGWEVSYNLNPLSASDKYSDPDGDGLKNYLEYSNHANPLNADTDNDGLSDYSEVYVYGTIPILYDTDSDGWSDKDEVDAGTDPLDPSSSPGSNPLPPSDPIFVP